MSEHLERLHHRISLASALAVAMCAAACLAVFWASASASGFKAERKTLEEVSNAPFVETDTDAGAMRIISGAPLWVRALVDGEGTVAPVEASGVQGASFDADDLAELVDLRDEWGSKPFAWGGRTWIGLWQPTGVQEGALIVPADGEGIERIDRERGTERRVYTFLDVSARLSSIRSFGLGCVAVCSATFLAALAVSWIAVGRAVRPVAEAEAREREFVCAASHDLVTPLMAVTANCDVLEAEVQDESSLAPWIANIRSATDEMALRIADMLAGMRRG